MRSIFLSNSFPWLTITTISFGFLFFILLNVNIAYSTPESSKISHLNESYWTIGKNMSTVRNELSAVVLNDKIYAIGGEDFPVGEGQKIP